MAWVRERLRAAGQVGQLAEGERDLGLDKPVSRPEANVPSISFVLDTHEHEVADSGQPELLADAPLRRLHRKGVGGAAAVAPEMDPACQVLVEDGPRLGRAHATVIEALRKADQVPGKAIAADVADLPEPAVLDLLAQRLVKRPAVACTAAVVLAVRTDEQERMRHRLTGGLEVVLQ